MKISDLLKQEIMLLDLKAQSKEAIRPIKKPQ